HTRELAAMTRSPPSSAGSLSFHLSSSGGTLSSRRVWLQIRPQRLPLALAQPDGDVQLFQILLQRLAAEVDLLRLEERAHPPFPFRRRQADHRLAQAPDAGGRQ